ncbi:DEAD/DEAH box helicase [Halobium salinum]|uniref:Putative DNA 3'-5' helicase Rad25 n=1 Tax=Halobium salinum TaxID=1364940 RepID=A0ABD5PEN6_9EURY|nr:DEAD/DEAH box helicase family protein [Halobium salinum]
MTDDEGVETDEAVDPGGRPDTTGGTERPTAFTLDDFYDAVAAAGTPVLTTAQVAARLDLDPETAAEGLQSLAEAGQVRRVVGDGTHASDGAGPDREESADRAEAATDDTVTDATGTDATATDDTTTDAIGTDDTTTADRPTRMLSTVWYPAELTGLTTRERVVLFPERREIVVDNPTQYTRAQLAQFAHLVDTTSERTDTAKDRNRGRGYLYRIRQEDVWHAPFDDVDDLLASMREVLPRRSPHLEEWVESQWKRAHQFTLYTHEDGYTVLEAANDNLMGNVARQKLSEEHLHAPISDTEAWVREGTEAEIKRILYEAGYPVRDERDLDTGDPVDVDLGVTLRDYQQDWVDRFTERKSGVLVGPPGAGKTIAAMGVLAAVGGETLILVPSRELARQWRDELLTHTSLTEAQIGEYHGGEKNIRPVTIATYQTAGMDRHRHLFDSRKWGLIIYDECHHVPASIYRRSADLQSKHRLGLTATPVRESGDEEEIFTLVGPPIGTDWDALFEAGFVQEPEVEIRYVPWTDDLTLNEWRSADGRERHAIAAQNPAKVEEVERLRRRHPEAKTLVFADYLDQGRDVAEALGVPFVSGETPHWERRRLFDEFRDGERDTLVVSRIADEGIDLPDAELAVVVSGLGGSRRQGAQRAGRTMRPTGPAVMYVLATAGTSEEDFAQRQMRHLAEKGIRVTESAVGGGDGDGDGSTDATATEPDETAAGDDATGSVADDGEGD